MYENLEVTSSNSQRYESAGSTGRKDTTDQPTWSTTDQERVSARAWSCMVFANTCLASRDARRKRSDRASERSVAICRASSAYFENCAKRDCIFLGNESSRKSAA